MEIEDQQIVHDGTDAPPTDGAVPERANVRERSAVRTVLGLGAMVTAALGLTLGTMLHLAAEDVILVVGDRYAEPAFVAPLLTVVSVALALRGWVVLRRSPADRVWTAGITYGAIAWLFLAWCALLSGVGLLVIFIVPLHQMTVLAMGLLTLVVLTARELLRRSGRDVLRGLAVLCVVGLVVASTTLLASSAALTANSDVTVSRSSDGTATAVRTDTIFGYERTAVYRSSAGSPLAHRQPQTTPGR